MARRAFGLVGFLVVAAIVALAVILLVLVVRPSGLFGRAAVRKV